jgi:hypothetical protein
MATVLTRTDLRTIVALANYERIVDPRTGRLRSQVVHYQRGASARPYVSPLPPDEYAVRGYAESDSSGVTYRAPDADVLLSNSFAASHCFYITASSDATQVGLGFRPVRPEPGRIDVDGTLLIDRRTGELRSLSFQYVGASDALAAARAGGRMDFTRLPTGEWVISDWEMTAPRIITLRGNRSEVAGSLAAPSPIVSRMSTRDSIADIWQIGGALLRVSVADAVVWRGSRGRLVGRVVDDADGNSIPGASIVLRGTNYATSADAHGDFVIDDVLRGSYDMEVHSPILRQLGLDIPSVVSVDLRDTTTVVASVRLPPLRNAVDRVCRSVQGTPGTDTLAAVQGIVDGPDHVPVAGAIVTARWLQHAIVNQEVFSAEEASATTTTGVDGSYRLCGVPTDRSLHIVAIRNNLRNVDVTIEVRSSSGLTTVDIALSAGDPRAIARRGPTGHGAFLSEEQIAARGATTTEDLLRGVPGLRMEHSANGGTTIVADRGLLSILNMSCQGVAVFIDDSEVPQPFDVNEIPPQSIRAVEYYSGPATTPPELRASKAVCATLAIWTK